MPPRPIKFANAEAVDVHGIKLVALSLECPPNCSWPSFPRARHAEALRLSTRPTLYRISQFFDVGDCRHVGSGRRHSIAVWPVHSNRGIHRLRRDGGRLFPGAPSAKLVSYK